MRDLVHQNDRIVEAESLPYLDIYSSEAASDRTPALRLAVRNEGVGPARIAEVVVTVNGTRSGLQHADRQMLRARIAQGEGRRLQAISIAPQRRRRPVLGARRMVRPGDEG